jgi:hypothetical protein
VRVEVFDECASIGVLTAVNCRVNGIYTQRIQPDQFYDYAFYFQYATLDPAVYSPDLSSYPAGLTSPSAQCSLRYAASTTPGYDRRSPACLSVAYQSTAAAAPYKRDVNNDGVLDDPPASDLHPNRDVIDGPLFTNDDQLVTCNSPVFRSRVYAEPTLSSTTGRTRSTSYSRVFQRLVPASGDQFVGCSASNFPILVGGASDQSQTPADAPGTRFGLKRASSEILLPNRQQFQEVATAVAGSARVSGTIALRPGRDSASSPYTFTEASYNGGEYTRVSNGFIYASGNTRVSGTYAGALSIYAEGEATISADLFGVRPSGDTCVALASQRGTADVDENGEGSNSEGRGGRGDGIIDDCRSVLGLTAGGKINIEQNAGGGRKVQAILVSLDNSPSVPQWYEEQPWAAAGTSPTLEFYGAMASKYQGIFGGYSSDETAKLLSGYRKDFHFDRRLTEGDLTPPFLPGPVVTDSWSRVDFSEAYRAD